MIASYLTAVRGFSRNARLFLLTLGLATLIIDGVYNVIFNLFLLRLGYDEVFVGTINSIALLTFAVASLPAGELGKRWGSRRAMIVGLYIVLVGSSALPCAGLLLPAWQAVWLVISYVIMFLGYAIFFVNGVPFLMESTTPEQRNHAFSGQTAIFSLAAFSGGLLGGVLPGLFAWLTGASTSDPGPYRVPLLVAALLLVPGIWAALRTTQDRPPARPQGPVNSIKRSQAPYRTYLYLLVIVSLVRVLQVAGMASATTFFNVFMDQRHHLPTAQIGVITAVARLASVPAALAVAGLVNRWGQRTLVIAAGLGTALSLLPMTFGAHWLAAAAGFVGLTICASIRYPTFLVYSMEMVTEEQRPTMSGLSEMTAGIAFSGMALLGGFLITRYGYGAHFLTGAVFVLLGTLIFAFYFRRPRGELAQLAAPAAD